MNKNFKQSFMYYVGGRTGEELAETYINKEEYKYHRQKQEEAYEKIKSLVPAESQKLLWEYFNEYESSCGLNEGIVQDTIYIYGIKDGMELKSLFNSMEENPTLKYICSFVEKYCKCDLPSLEKKYDLMMLYHQTDVLADIMRSIDVQNVLYDKLYSFRYKINDYLKDTKVKTEIAKIA